ncbi:MAG: hypothetical protein BWY38_03236 [Ignavibacteria bacterium ADurb.Bin266]|nr:MAG: hypothetical protein BWY38_03236 [Ignavibacteria bacterium ADurb.Bin266]
MKSIKYSILIISLYCISNIKAQQLNLLPEIPEPELNAHIATAFDGVKVGNFTFNKSFAEAEEILLAAMAYFHPNSPYKGQQGVLNRLLFMLDIIFSGWDDGSMPLNDMQFCFQANVSYLMLKRYQPSVIPEVSREKWESGIRKNISAILSAKPDMYDRHIVGSIWLNGDIRLALGVYFGGIIFNDTQATEKARVVIEEVMPRTLLGDGATHYVGYSNESPSYHGEATIRPFLWYYIFTRSQAVKNFISATDKYIPLVNIPVGEGYKEWSTSPAWKPYYNRVSLKPEALAKAYLSGNAYNFEIGKGSQMLFLAFLYRSNVTPMPLPDNYMLYDKNSLGPRGRYGNWGVVATLRDPSIPGPELSEERYLNMDGNNTFVGSFTLNASAGATTYPLNAAFQGTAPQIKYATGEETDFSRGNKWAFLTGKDRNDAITKSKLVYGLSSTYLISKKRFVDQKWKANQLWVVTPDRIIGLCEAEALETNSVYGFAHRVQLVSGRRNASGTRKTLITNNFQTFDYGDLRLKIHDKDYTGKVDTFYHGVMNDPLDKSSVMIELHDSQSGNDQLVTYNAGTKRFVLLESTNNARSYAQNVTKLNLLNGLSGFEFLEPSKRKIRIIYNYTGQSLFVPVQSFGSTFNRVRLIQSFNNSEEIIYANDNNSVTIPSILLPPFQHLLIISSNNEFDMQNSLDKYEDVFSSQISTVKTKPFFKNDISLAVNGRNILIKNDNQIPLSAFSIYTLDGKILQKFELNNFNSSYIQIPEKYSGTFLCTLSSDIEILYSEIIKIQ